MEADKIEELKGFVEHCKQNPSVLHTPPLAFFNNFLRSMGAEIPPSGKSGEDGQDHVDESQSESEISYEDIVESDIELDNSDVVEPDGDPPVKMGDPCIEVTEVNQEAAQLSKAKAMDAVANGNFNEAIDHLTEAIMLNPKSAILYASRASVFLKLKKPNAAIRDADAALQINPDSAKGYKVRGMARAMLGSWEEAARDLHVASNLDFDEEIALLLKKVEPNANKIEEHRRKYKRLRKEEELRKLELEKQRHERHEKAEAASLLKDGEVIVINSAGELKTKLNAAAKASRLTIIYFTATWCGPCRYVSPEVIRLAAEYPKVVFLKVDVDEASHAAIEWNVSSIPCFFFVKNRAEVEKFVGTDINLLKRKINQHSG